LSNKGVKNGNHDDKLVIFDFVMTTQASQFCFRFFIALRNKGFFKRHACYFTIVA